MDMHATINRDTINSNPPPEATDQRTAAQVLDDYLAADKYGYQEPHRGDLRMGVVVEINEQGVIMDIGYKREGIVPVHELNHLDNQTRAEIQPGASMRVFVVRPSDQDGRPVLSIHQARLNEDWIKAEEMMKSGELYEAPVAGHNRGGLIVKFGKIRGFIPSSQIVGLPKRLRDDQRLQRLEAMVGQQVGLKIVEVDREHRRLIFSQRRAFRAWQERQRERLLEQLRPGETRRGRVTSITDFGAFVDLGGADGLIHVSELSWSRVENPRQVLKVGQEVEVYVLSVDPQRKRVALSLKKLQPDPWTLADERYKQGQLVEGRITRVLDFGAFVELDLGIEGLLHAREMIGAPEHAPAELVHPGERVLLKVLRVDSQKKRLDLSAKQVQRHEWEQWAAEHATAPAAEAAPVNKTPTGSEAETVSSAEEAGSPQAATISSSEASGL